LQAATLAVGGIDLFAAMLAKTRKGSTKAGSIPSSARACRISSSRVGRPRRREDFCGVIAILNRPQVTFRVWLYGNNLCPFCPACFCHGWKIPAARRKISA
jgi:hypothetical protein